MDYAILFLIGRIFFAGYFLRNALNHFVNLGMMSGYAASKGVPMPQLAVLGTGLLLAVAGLGILLGVWVDVAVVALLLFLIPVTFQMHAYWKIRDPMMQMTESINFWKNLALLGAALMLLMIPQPWAYSVAF